LILIKIRTPVENRLSELWSIFDFALPKYLGTIKTFSTRFGKEIEVNRNESVVTLLKGTFFLFFVLYFYFFLLFLLLRYHKSFHA